MYSYRKPLDINLHLEADALLELGEMINDYRMLIPSPSEINSIGRLRKSKTRFWQPYTRFGFNYLNAFAKISNRRVASVTFQLSEDVSRLIYKSNNPTSTMHNKLQYYFKQVFDYGLEACSLLSVQPNVK